MAHALLNLTTRQDIEGNPKSGATWEGFVVEQLVGILRAAESECFHWPSQAGSERDFLHVRGALRMGFKIKRTVAPKLTKSMRIALEYLKLNNLYVVHAGEHSYPLAEKIFVVPLGGIQKLEVP